jgi:hypothetical protein
MPQPKAFQKYQRGRSSRFNVFINDLIRRDMDTCKALFEDKVAQRVSYPVLLHRMTLVMLDHLAGAGSIAERDILVDLIARGEVVERETPRGPELVINLAAFTGAAGVLDAAAV